MRYERDTRLDQALANEAAQTGERYVLVINPDVVCGVFDTRMAAQKYAELILGLSSARYHVVRVEL